LTWLDPDGALLARFRQTTRFALLLLVRWLARLKCERLAIRHRRCKNTRFAALLRHRPLPASSRFHVRFIELLKLPFKFSTRRSRSLDVDL